MIIPKNGTFYLGPSNGVWLMIWKRHTGYWDKRRLVVTAVFANSALNLPNLNPASMPGSSKTLDP
jgi:hypothetical protein